MAPGRDAASPRSDVLVKETSDHVVIQLETTPPGAQVFDQRKPLGRTPLTLRRRRSDQPLQVRFTLTGFERLRVAVSQNQSQRLHYTLSKRKRQDSIFRPLER